MTYHLIGIGGAGMSVVAELLMAGGATVSGSDARASAATDHLVSLGASVSIGQAADNVPRDAVVVVSSAIRRTNPEYAIALERGQRILHRSQALALASAGRDFVAVAGAHGKTSTSAMLAVALRELGADPSWAIGGTVTGVGAGAHLGEGTVLVAEADESDASFLNYTPRLEIVTNVEPDHLDHYGSREAFEEAFVEFSRRLVPEGLLVVCADDDGAARLGLQSRSEGIRVVSYGRGEALVGAERHVRIADESHMRGRASGSFVDETGTYPVRLQVVGGHNLLNAAGAWAAGIELGHDRAALAHALGEFAGTGRRFETKGEEGGITVIDDYAHHPTEVAATLQAARERAGDGRVLVLFQPHLYSRTRNFANEFARALELADVVVVTGVYAAREDPMPGVEGDLIAGAMDAGVFIQDKNEAASWIADQARRNDIVLTVGAGDVTELGPQILRRIAAR
ncbi:UDP-N-acetylmuramate--L-alanine ligase [Actinomycetaceae bacterium L2_0104]